MRKIISLLISILFVSSLILTVSAYSDEDFINGDVNLDGRISIADATEIQKKLADTVVFTEQQKKLADFNLDGEINIIDVTKI